MNELSYQSYILSRSLWLWGGDDNEKDGAKEDPEIGLRKLLQIFRVDGRKDISLKCSTLKNWKNNMKNPLKGGRFRGTEMPTRYSNRCPFDTGYMSVAFRGQV